MVHPFISTQTIRFQLAEAAVSFVTHGGLIAVAVTTSGLPARPVELAPRVRSEHVTFIRTPAPARATPVVRRVERKSSAGETVAEKIMRKLAAVDAVQVELDNGVLVPSIDIDAAVPAMSYGSFMGAEKTEPMAFARGVLGRNAFAPRGAHDAYEEHVVERAVFSRLGNPKPDYPEDLRRRGVEASFMVQFVVDSTGRVEKNAIDFLEQAQRPFLDAVRQSLLRSRYYPAELDGRRVRQLVRQKFIFKMER
jgi:hypothetical protein